MSIQKRPAVRQIQPTGFLGRLEAIRAPTRGKARKGTNTNRPPTVPQVLEGRVSGASDKDNRVSATPATNIVRESPASDQASQEEARNLIPPTPRSCSASPSLTTPLYFLDLLGRTAVRCQSTGARRSWAGPASGSPIASGTPRAPTAAPGRPATPSCAWCAYEGSAPMAAPLARLLAQAPYVVVSSACSFCTPLPLPLKHPSSESGFLSLYSESHGLGRGLIVTDATSPAHPSNELSLPGHRRGIAGASPPFPRLRSSKTELLRTP